MSDWDEAFVLEMKTQHIISEQGRHGCNFDSRGANWHCHSLGEQIVNIDKVLVPMLPLMMNTNNKNYYKKPFKLNGQPMAYVQKYMDKVGLERKEIGGPFSPVFFTPFDPSKTAKIKMVMFDYGWIPSEWNTKKVSIVSRANQNSLRKNKNLPAFFNRMDDEEEEEIKTMINKFIEKHFTKTPLAYKKQVVRRMGFTRGKAPTVGEISMKLLTNNFWITGPKINPDKDKWASNEYKEVADLLKDRMKCSHRKSLIEGLLKVTRGDVAKDEIVQRELKRLRRTDKTGKINPLSGTGKLLSLYEEHEFLYKGDGKIPGEANPCATPTARFKHRKIVNIPAGRAYFGKQCRSLFIGDYNDDPERKPVITRHKLKDGERVAPHTNLIEEWDGKKGVWKKTGHTAKSLLPANQNRFVGGDGAGLELRILTHFLVSICKMLWDTTGLDKYKVALDAAYEYRRILLEGDIHSHNQKLAGLPTRDAAKSFIYAFLYGAGAPLLGALIGGGKQEGEMIKGTFLAECPCITVLIEYAQDHAKKFGWVPGLDGRKLIMRRDPDTGEVQTHKALNTMLQGGGAVVMKRANAILIDDIKDQEIDAHQVIMMHDEFQFTVVEKDTKRLRGCIDVSVMKAGLFYKMDIELASDSMEGKNWYDTH